ncbi:hypothetical protein V5F59_22465 [Xanthobacter autotrophicus DSM 431]|uniref:hypothetical protein n=1 Tax=Xanthobacter nonsaccharivorans TaxID=3119912 RepID=UPI0037286C27
MSTVIAFPTARRAPVRGQAARRRMAREPRPEGAQIVILPVIRIERHEAGETEEAARGANNRRAH